MACFLIAFHVVAACRALVPGLCATQEAVKASADAAQACAIEAASCCVTFRNTDGDTPAGDAYTPPPKDHPSCAFCHLVMANVLPSIPAATAPPAACAPDRAAPMAVAPNAADTVATNIGRDPPPISA